MGIQGRRHHTLQAFVFPLLLEWLPRDVLSLDQRHLVAAVGAVLIRGVYRLRPPPVIWWVTAWHPSLQTWPLRWSVLG